MMTTLTELDFDQYLVLLGQPRESLRHDLPTLARLQRAHTERVAFQSLTTVLQQPISLEMTDIFRKVVRERRGGYCYELNLLFAALLMHLGFSVRTLSAAVVHENQPDRPQPHTHVLLEVVAEGKTYLVDVGFGGLNPTAPLQLGKRSSQSTPHGAFRIQPHRDELLLVAEVGHEWHMMYRFDMQTQHLPDLEVGSWYVSTHPRSPFRSRLMAARTGSNGVRHTLRNRRYSRHQLGQESVHQELADAAEVLSVLEQIFGLNTEGVDRERLQRFLDQL